MKKQIMKVFTLAMVAAFSVTTITGCRGNEGPSVDDTKAQLWIANQDAGIGHVWIEEVAENFETYYANKDFGDGKVGVQVHIENKIDEFSESALLNSIKNYDYDVYYIDSMLGMETFIQNGLIVNMTDAYTAKIYDDNGDLAEATGNPATRSVMDTMYDGWAENYNKGTESAPAYYGLPYYMSIDGIIYDADLFDEKGLFLDASNEFGATYADIASGNCSKGPDGVLGTSDDGMPATWNEFMNLLHYMTTDKNVIPFTWAGTTNYQRQKAYRAIWANYEGANDFELNYSFAGTDSQFGDITTANAYKLRGQEGRKAGIKAMSDIVKNAAYYSTKAFTNSHLEAEQEFVESKMTQQRIAMFMEGSYWENEARTSFDNMSVNPADGYGQRNLRLLPIPRFVGTTDVQDQTSTERVLPAAGSSSMEFVSASGENTEVAKLFLQFAHSREQLAVFTKNTSCLRAFNFEPGDNYSEFTKFTQSIYDFMYNDAKKGGVEAKVVPDLITAQARKTNRGTFSDWNFSAVVNGGTYVEVMDAFKGNSDLTVAKCFEQMLAVGKYTEAKWNYK